MTPLQRSLAKDAFKVHVTTHGHAVIAKKEAGENRYSVFTVSESGELCMAPILQSEADAVKVFSNIYRAIR